MIKLDFLDIDDYSIIDEIVKKRQNGVNADFFYKYKNLWKKELNFYITEIKEKGWMSPYYFSYAKFKQVTFENLYKSADYDNERWYIKDYRDNHDLQMCPMCGKTGADSLDHILPQSKYPQYILFSKNLIPCCYKCNLIKNNKIGNISERFINPYYDDFLSGQVIELSITFKKRTPVFLLIPYRRLTEKQKKIINYQIETLEINTDIVRHFKNIWRSFKKAVEKENTKVLTRSVLISNLEDRCDKAMELKDEEYSSVNNWDSIFYRSIRNRRSKFRKIISIILDEG